jgi:prepilin-type N-terminal cleavage/methylation domain-containing protein/prepilin-type processing-associated H-X9-DG protein
MPGSPVPLRTARGFTLIELLVVIGIIAILAGVIFAAADSALQAAHRTQCLANMRQIGMATIAYAGDNNSNLPITDNPAWDVPLAPYLDMPNITSANPILKCPSDTRPLVNGAKFARSYSFNGNLVLNGIKKLVQVASVSPPILVAEWYSGGTTGPGGAGANYQYQGSFNTVVYGTGAIPSSNGNPGYHGPTSNFVFTDGHAESINPANTLTTSPSMWQVTR